MSGLSPALVASVAEVLRPLENIRVADQAELLTAARAEAIVRSIRDYFTPDRPPRHGMIVFVAKPEQCDQVALDKAIEFFRDTFGLKLEKSYPVGGEKRVELTVQLIRPHVEDLLDDGVGRVQGVSKALDSALAEGLRVAKAVGMEFLGRDELLLGLLTVSSSVCAQALDAFGVDRETAYANVCSRVNGRLVFTDGSDAPELPRTGECQQVMLDAIAIAKEMQHGYVATDHVMLALLRADYPSASPSGVAWFADQYAIDYRSMRDKVTAIHRSLIA